MTAIAVQTRKRIVQRNRLFAQDVLKNVFVIVIMKAHSDKRTFTIKKGTLQETATRPVRRPAPNLIRKERNVYAEHHPLCRGK
ncbi:MAG: hypothetical protein LUC48_05730, partial [Clostridiales bacterium]|nr:hypothetical protein [Clostridiales bacterium]